MILEIYRYVPLELIPRDFPNIELDQLLKLRVQAQYVQELEAMNMQKAVAKALGAE